MAYARRARLSFCQPVAAVVNVGPVALPAVAASMPSNKLTPKFVQELYPEQDLANLEKLIANSKGLQKVCNALLKGALCHSQLWLWCSVWRCYML